MSVGKEEMDWKGEDHMEDASVLRELHLELQNFSPRTEQLRKESICEDAKLKIDKDTTMGMSLVQDESHAVNKEESRLGSTLIKTQIVSQ